jgi:hypothetical protein
LTERDRQKLLAAKREELALIERMARVGAAQRSFSAFRSFVRRDYQEWSYVKPMNDLLERCFAREVRRAIICLPPQSGKTATVSEDFPAYVLGREADVRVLSAAYNSDRASDYGEAVRDLVASPEYRSVFPGVSLAADKQAKDAWAIEVGGKKRGTYNAAGVGTALTGRAGDIMIIDDPFKDREEADSEITKDR